MRFYSRYRDPRNSRYNFRYGTNTCNVVPASYNSVKMKKKKKRYDSTADTLMHVKRVNELLGDFSKKLIDRGIVHDNSKLENPEKECFDRLTPVLKDCEYDSDEYKSHLEELKPALEHHYAKNPHHPQHYSNGIDGMNLVDLIEMFVDWKASSERQNNGNICKSIEINKERFQMSDQLASIFENTVKYFGW